MTTEASRRQLFQYTGQQYRQIFKGDPRKNYRGARSECVKLAFKNLWLTPILIPVELFTCSVIDPLNIITDVWKHIFKEKRGAQIKQDFTVALDDGFLMFSLPFTKAALIGKLILASITHPAVHFRKPHKFSVDVQLKYYTKEVQKLWQQLEKRTKKNHKDLIDNFNGLNYKKVIKDLTSKEDTVSCLEKLTAELDKVLQKEAFDEGDFNSLGKIIQRRPIDSDQNEQTED